MSFLTKPFKVSVQLLISTSLHCKRMWCSSITGPSVIIWSQWALSASQPVSLCRAATSSSFHCTSSPQPDLIWYLIALSCCSQFPYFTIDKINDHLSVCFKVAVWNILPTAGCVQMQHPVRREWEPGKWCERCLFLQCGDTSDDILTLLQPLWYYGMHQVECPLKNNVKIAYKGSCRFRTFCDSAI